MEAHDLIFLAAFVVVLPAGIWAACLSRRVQEVLFFLLVAGSAFTERMDINFLSREWYRGTTRGIEVSFIDFLALILLAACLLKPRTRPRFLWPAGLVPLLLYFGWCAASVGLSRPSLFGLFELSKVLRGIVVFLAAAAFIRSGREVKVLLLGLAAAVLVEGLAALRDRYIWGEFRVAAYFPHPNSLSMHACIAAPVMAAAALSDAPRAMRRLFALCAGLAAVAVILTISRTGFAALLTVMAGTAALCFSFRLTLRRAVTAALILLVATAGLARSWDTVKSRFLESSLEDEYGSKDVTQGRGVYLHLARMIAKGHFCGIGLNNWSFAVTNEYAPRIGMHYIPYIDTEKKPYDGRPPDGLDACQAAPAHNLGALTLGELGWPGLLLFALVWLSWFRTAGSFLRRRSAALLSRFGTGVFLGLAAAFFQSFTEWEYRQTPIFFLIHILAGSAAALYYLRRREGRCAA